MVPEASQRREAWLHKALLVALCAALWGPSLDYGLVWDDHEFIVANPAIRSLRNIPAMFLRLEAQAARAESFRVFRPLRTALYALLFRLGGGEWPRPWLYHLNSVLWHVACVLLLYAFVDRLGRRVLADLEARARRRTAFVCAVGLAANPVVTEAVCWVKGLDDLMASAFVLGAAVALLREGPAPPRATVALLFALAVYSKVSAVPFVALAPLMLVLFRGYSLRAALLESRWLAAVASGFLVHRHLVLGQTSQIAPLSGTWVGTLVDMGPVIPIWLRLLCGVPPFSIDYGWLRIGHSPFDGAVLAGAGLLLLWMAVGAWALRDEQRKVPALGFAWTSLFLLPVSNLVPMMQFVAERFLYLPLVGWLIFLLGILRYLSRWMAGVLALALLLTWSVLSVERSTLWRDDLELFGRSAIEGPVTSRMIDNAVGAAAQSGSLAAVTRELSSQRLLLRTPEERRELGNIDWQAVDRLLDLLDATYPGNHATARIRAIVAARRGDYGGALGHLEASVAEVPNDPNVWACVGMLRLDAGSFEEARQALDRALTVEPDNRLALKALAQWYWRQGELAEARRTYQRILRLYVDPLAREWLDRLESAPGAGRR